MGQGEEPCVVDARRRQPCRRAVAVGAVRRVTGLVPASEVVRVTALAPLRRAPVASARVALSAIRRAVRAGQGPPGRVVDDRRPEPVGRVAGLAARRERRRVVARVASGGVGEVAAGAARFGALPDVVRRGAVTVPARGREVHPLKREARAGMQGQGVGQAPVPAGMAPVAAVALAALVDVFVTRRAARAAQARALVAGIARRQRVASAQGEAGGIVVEPVGAARTEHVPALRDVTVGAPREDIPRAVTAPRRGRDRGRGRREGRKRRERRKRPNESNREGGGGTKRHRRHGCPSVVGPRRWTFS
jgi:hypothetical protein